MPTLIGPQPRPPKALGNQRYQDEVAHGKPDIVDVEVDNDIDTLYNMCNGGLTKDNLYSSAGITIGQLHRPIGIQDQDITSPPAPGGISGAKIQPGTLPGDRIVPGSVPAGSLGPKVVVFGNMNLFASMESGTPASLANESSFDLSAAETLIHDATWTTRGGPILIWAVAYVTFENVNTAVADGIEMTARLRGGKNGGSPGGVDGDILLARSSQSLGIPAGTFGFGFPFRVPVTFELPYFYSTLLDGYAGPVRFKLTLDAAVSSGAKATHRYSSLIAVELA